MKSVHFKHSKIAENNILENILKGGENPNTFIKGMAFLFETLPENYIQYTLFKNHVLFKGLSRG